MRVFASCMVCQRELGQPSFEPIFATYFEDRLASVKCARGHESVLMLQGQKFEVLLESGAAALDAGFTLEAAASFSAAFERFFEFCTRTMLVHQGLLAAEIDEVFLEMSRQSERQLGAFLTLHRIVLGKPYSPNRQVVEFRNAVIHKGKIPTPLEVDEFCSKIYAEILPITKELKSKCSDAIQTVSLDDMRIRQAKVPAGTVLSTMAGGSFSLLTTDQNPPSFKAAFESYVSMAKAIQQALPEMERLSKLNPPRLADA